MQWLQNLAAQKGGKCLSTEYSGVMSKYWWVCAKGDKWEAKANSVQQGGWCPSCAGKAPHDLRWLQELAAKRGGRLLSDKYYGVMSKYWWECAKGDKWEAVASSIQQGGWCPHCAGMAPRDLQWLQELAAQKGGRCLATEYSGMLSRYWWECAKGYRWEAVAGDIQQDHWCPHCSKVSKTSRGEIELREFVKRHYLDTAERGVRRLLPNRRFELDIWIPSLRKAIEFDGEYRHDTPKRRASDARKDAECLQAGIKLLRVRYKDYVKNKEETRQKVLKFLKTP